MKPQKIFCFPTYLLGIIPPSSLRRIPRSSRLFRFAFSVLIVFIFSGCATSPDPSKGGFISGLVGIAGGGYQRRIEAGERTYQDALNTQGQLQLQAHTLEQERTAVRSELDRATSRLRALESRIEHERARLATQRTAERKTKSSRLVLAETKLEQAKNDLSSIKVEDPSMNIEATKKRVQALEEQLNEIDALATIGYVDL